MSTLLHISVSPRGNYSISRQLSDAALQAWKDKNPGGRVIERDLAKTPLTFVDLDWIAGAFSPRNTTTKTTRKRWLSPMNSLPNSLRPTRSFSQPRCTTSQFRRH